VFINTEHFASVAFPPFLPVILQSSNWPRRDLATYRQRPPIRGALHHLFFHESCAPCSQSPPPSICRSPIQVQPFRHAAGERPGGFVLINCSQSFARISHRLIMAPHNKNSRIFFPRGPRCLGMFFSSGATNSRQPVCSRINFSSGRQKKRKQSNSRMFWTLSGNRPPACQRSVAAQARIFGAARCAMRCGRPVAASRRCFRE